MLYRDLNNFRKSYRLQKYREVIGTYFPIVSISTKLEYSIVQRVLNEGDVKRDQ